MVLTRLLNFVLVTKQPISMTSMTTAFPFNQLCYSQAPPNPFPSSLVSDWLPILIQCVISPLIGLRSLVIQSQMWTRCTSPALLYCSCILTESTCRSNQSDNLTPLHRQAGIPSAERLMQLSFPLAVELSCFFTSSLDCAPVRTILLLSLSLSLSVFSDTVSGCQCSTDRRSDRVLPVSSLCSGYSECPCHCSLFLESDLPPKKKNAFRRDCFLS